MECQSIDIKLVREKLIEYVKADIKEFNRPAIMYNYHHSTHVFNTRDNMDEWTTQ